MLCFALLPLVLERFKSCLLLLAPQAGLICTVGSLKVPAVIGYDVATKVLDTNILSAQHRWHMISGITFIVLFSQEKLLR